MSTSMTSTLRRERTNTVSSQASAPHPLAPPPTPTFSSKPFDWGNTIIIYDGSSSEYLHLLSDDLSELPKSITTSNKPSVAPMMFESDHIASYHQQPAIAMHPSPLSPVVQQQQSTKGAVKQTSSEYQTKGEQPSVLCTSPVLEFRKSSEEDTTADSTDISEEDNTFDSEDDNESTNNTKSAKIRNRCIRRDTMWAMTDGFNDGEINRQLIVQLNALVRSETLYVRTLTMLRDAFWRSIDEERIAEGNGLRRSGKRLLNVLTSAVNRRKPGLRRKSISSDDSASDRPEPSLPAGGDQLMNGSDTIANRWYKPSWCVCSRREITERGMHTLHALFSNIAPLAECHMHFLLKMRRLQPLSEHLDEFLSLLYDHMLTCKVYVIYLKEHIDALVEFENMLLCDERLSKEIARCEAQVGVKLRALLTKPVERPWYYAHVVQVIFNNYLPKSKQSTQALTACVSKSTNLTNELEIMVQQITQIKQIASLQRSFIQLPAPFLHQDQRIIQERSIQFRRYRKTNWQRCTYWLLSDRIIIGREKDESTYVCEVCIPLNRCIVSADTNCSEPFVGLLQINGISPMFQVQLESSGTFNYWISQLETAISQSKDDDAQINIPCGHGCLPRSTDPFFPDFHNFSIISPKNIG